MVEYEKTLFDKIAQAVEEGNDELTREALDDNNASTDRHLLLPSEY